MTTPKKCATCKGEGVWKPTMNLETCPDCNGTGREPNPGYLFGREESIRRAFEEPAQPAPLDLHSMRAMLSATKTKWEDGSRAWSRLVTDDLYRMAGSFEGLCREVERLRAELEQLEYLRASLESVNDEINAAITERDANFEEVKKLRVELENMSKENETLIFSVANQRTASILERAEKAESCRDRWRELARRTRVEAHNHKFSGERATCPGCELADEIDADLAKEES